MMACSCDNGQCSCKTAKTPNLDLKAKLSLKFGQAYADASEETIGLLEKHHPFVVSMFSDSSVEVSISKGGHSWIPPWKRPPPQQCCDDARKDCEAKGLIMVNCTPNWDGSCGYLCGDNIDEPSEPSVPQRI